MQGQELKEIRFNEPFLGGNELRYLQDVVESRTFAGNGPYTKRCQKLLESSRGVPHVLWTHSCTAALEMSALPGDEVILPSYTFCSTASAFLRAGATLRFCEVDSATMNLDVEDAIDRITDRTRAIVPVHYGGIPADIPGLQKRVGGRDILIVEDAAQGLGSKLSGKPLGTLAPLGCLSFHETKNIHCGLGGALFVNCEAMFERLENIWERGTDRAKMFRGLVDKYSWVDIGSSFYPTELQAAFLLAQLEVLERNQAERAALYESYRSELAELESPSTFYLPTVEPEHQLNYHSFYLICDSREQNDRLRAYLGDRGIRAYIGYVPLHSSKMGQALGFVAEELPRTEDLAARVVRLPLHNFMSIDDVRRVCFDVRSFYSQG